MMDSRSNYYEILEVAPSATQHDIVLAFEKAKRTYSDKNPALYSVFSPDEATALRKLIEEAYEVLSNQTYRNIYEKRLLSKSYAQSDLSLDAIKAECQSIYQQSVLMPVEPLPPRIFESSNAFKRDEAFEVEINSTTNWDGALLKKVREYRNLSLEVLHERTKINPWYLTAIEKMDPANLPAPVFVRGYIIQIARLLSLDEKVVAESYMKAFKSVLEPKK